MSNLRQVRNIIYNLKRQYPSAITLKNVTEVQVDRAMGKQTLKTRTHDVKRAVVLPTKSVPDFVYDLSFIAANKNFTYGGLFDAKTTSIIIDGKDVPSDFEINFKTKIIKDLVNHEIKNIGRTVDGRSYILTVTSLASMEKVDE